ncbi:S49 family peptidase, partial [Yersinia enterocolitica]
IAERTIRDTEAACYLAADGVQLGLADQVASPDAAFRDLLKLVGENNG